MDKLPSQTYFLIYASTATSEPSVPKLLALLEKARRFNAQNKVTGLLLYSPGANGEAGTFVQVLEGPESAVTALYQQIVKDPLHTDCTVVRSGRQGARRFPDWTMGFRNLGDINVEAKGFNPIFQRPLTLTRILAETDPVLQMVYSFAGSDAS